MKMIHLGISEIQAVLVGAILKNSTICLKIGNPRLQSSKICFLCYGRVLSILPESKLIRESLRDPGDFSWGNPRKFEDLHANKKSKTSEFYDIENKKSSRHKYSIP